LGIITRREVTCFLASMKLNLDSDISRGVDKEFKKLKLDDSIKYLSRAFERYSYVLIQEGNTNTNTNTNKESFYICEPKHLLDHFVRNHNTGNQLKEDLKIQ
jgi:hypothetical protein